MSLLQVDPIELEFGYGIIPLADVNQGGDLLDRVVMIRRQIALELGTIVPIIRLRDNIQLNPNQYIIKIKGVQVTEGEILIDHYMNRHSISRRSGLRKASVNVRRALDIRLLIRHQLLQRI